MQGALVAIDDSDAKVYNNDKTEFDTIKKYFDSLATYISSKNKSGALENAVIGFQVPRINKAVSLVVKNNQCHFGLYDNKSGKLDRNIRFQELKLMKSMLNESIYKRLTLQIDNYYNLVSNGKEVKYPEGHVYAAWKKEFSSKEFAIRQRIRENVRSIDTKNIKDFQQYRRNVSNTMTAPNEQNFPSQSPNNYRDSRDEDIDL